jgi:hypothetical protein
MAAFRRCRHSTYGSFYVKCNVAPIFSIIYIMRHMEIPAEGDDQKPVASDRRTADDAAPEPTQKDE